MLHDQHAHTYYSLDSDASIDNYYKIASNYNTKYFICTDHIEFDSLYNFQNWTVDYDSLKEDLKRLGNIYPSVTPLLGIEIGYRKDHLKDMDKTINSQDFDLVNMSIHDNGKYDYYMKESYKEIGISNMLDIYFNNIIDGLDNYTNFDVLSHFDYGFKTAYLIDHNKSINEYETIVREIFRKVIRLNKTIEINMKVQTVLGLEHLKTWLNWYHEEGGTKLTFSSDAHSEVVYEEYYKNQSKYFEIIKSAGFDHLIYFVKRKEYIYKI